MALRRRENFIVASLLLPRSLRQHFYNVYAWCRLADDLADESGSGEQSLRLLDDWQKQFDQSLQGRPSGGVHMALAHTMHSFGIPRQPFEKLLAAFRQDQLKHRYETFDELLEYCRRSANPVGEIVLRLGECYDPVRAALSDSICTGLQLANFCQDVARDRQKGRIYLPLESCRQFAYEEADFAARRANEAFRRLLEHEVNRAESYLLAGQPLVALMPAALRVDVALFVEGGLAILAEIRRQNYDVWTRRPTVSGLHKLRMLARCWWQYRGERGKA